MDRPRLAQKLLPAKAAIDVPLALAIAFVADQFDGAVPHLNGHDVTLVCASIAPLERLRAYKERMGWRFPWVSSLATDFNYDFGVAFTVEQQQNGAEYNFQHIDEVGPQRVEVGDRSLLPRSAFGLGGKTKQSAASLGRWSPSRRASEGSSARLLPASDSR